MSLLNVYRYLKRTAMAGPGMRYCIWVQGCSRHCAGCMAPETWSHSGGTPMDIAGLESDIVSVADIEGLTFLGGEPFEQASAASRLALAVRERGLSVVTFTGFTLDELSVSREEGVSELINATDLLIAGPFLEASFDISRPWVGSANQKYHYLTDRYNPGDVDGVPNRIEVRIDQNGKAFINGMGDFNKIKKLLS